MRRLSRLGVLAALGLALAACEPAEDVEPFACDSPVPGIAELGIGDLGTGFVPLADGDDLQIVLGAQGLHMVVLSMRIQGFEMPRTSGQNTMVTTATRTDGQVIAGMQRQLKPDTAAADQVEFLGLRTVFVVDELAAYVGRIVDAVVTATDGCGRTITARRSVRLVQ